MADLLEQMNVQITRMNVTRWNTEFARAVRGTSDQGEGGDTLELNSSKCGRE